MSITKHRMKVAEAEALLKDGSLITRFDEGDYLFDPRTCGLEPNISASIVPITVIKKLEKNGQLLLEKINDDKTAFYRVKIVKDDVSLPQEIREIVYSEFILSFNITRMQYRLNLLYSMFENLSLDKLQQDVVVYSFLEICRSVINIGKNLSMSNILYDGEAIVNLVDVGIVSEQDAEIFLEMLSFRDMYLADSIEYTNKNLEQFFLNSTNEFDRFIYKIKVLVGNYSLPTSDVNRIS